MRFLKMSSGRRIINSEINRQEDTVAELKKLIFKNGALYDGIVSSSKMLCHIDKNRLYDGTITSSSKVLCTIEDGKIYQGTIVSSSKQLGFVEDGKAYEGRSNQALEWF